MTKERHAIASSLHRTYLNIVSKSVIFLVLLASMVGCRSELSGIDPDLPVQPEFLDNLTAINDQIALEDGGYGASLLLDDSDGLAGTVAFRAIESEGSTLRLIEWDARENDRVDETVIASNVGQTFSLHRLPNTELRVIVGASLAEAGGTASLTVWEEKSGGGWVPVVLDQSEDNARIVDAVVDIDGALHIAYISDGTNQLRYVLWQDGVFLTQPDRIVIVDKGTEGNEVGPGGTIEASVSIALLDQAPIVSYYDGANGRLRVAIQNPDTFEWQVQVVGFPVRQEVLVVNPNGNADFRNTMIPRKAQVTLYKNLEPLPDSSYTILSDQRIAINDVDVSAEYEVDYITPVSIDYGVWSDIQVDDAGGAAVSFYDFRGGRVMYATNSDVKSSDSWSLQVVDEQGIVGGVNRLLFVPLLNADDVQVGQMPVIVYQDIGNSDLLMAFRKSGSWTRRSLVRNGLTGFGSVAQVSEGGWVSIAYRIHSPDTFQANLQLVRALPIEP